MRLGSGAGSASSTRGHLTGSGKPHVASAQKMMNRNSAPALNYGRLRPLPISSSNNYAANRGERYLNPRSCGSTPRAFRAPVGKAGQAGTTLGAARCSVNQIPSRFLPTNGPASSIDRRRSEGEYQQPRDRRHAWRELRPCESRTSRRRRSTPNLLAAFPEPAMS
jgi:hypothetical protein